MNSNKQLRFGSLQILAIALCIGLTGCGPNDGKIEVVGKVICDGEPLQGASVVFVANGGGSFGTASTDATGKFTLRSLPGVNKISVSALDVSKADEWADIPEEMTTMGTPEETAEAMKNMPKPLVAQKFFNADTSGLEANVTEGMAEVTLEVTAND